MNKISKTIGWEPGCGCKEEIDTGGQHPDGSWITDYEVPRPIPCTVLDPFMGAGTTALVAIKHGRNWIGIELNPDYAQQAQERIHKQFGLWKMYNLIED